MRGEEAVNLRACVNILENCTLSTCFECADDRSGPEVSERPSGAISVLDHGREMEELDSA